MEDKFYADYRNDDIVLVFDTQQERDDFVLYEQLVHTECRPVSYQEIAERIQGKTTIFDSGFGCMTIQ